MASKKNQPPTPGTLRASDVKAEPINWLWPAEGNLAEEEEDYRAGRIPDGMFTLLGGRPGRGKSMAAAYFAAYVSNLPGPRNGVLFSNMEDPVAQVQRPRLEAVGANLRNVHFFNFFLPKDDMGIEQSVEMLRTMIYGLGIKLILVDPIAAHLGVSIYNDQETRRVLSPLTAMLAETQTALIAVSHVNKHISKNADPQSAFGGSGGGLMGAARAAYAFDKDPSDESIRVMAHVKFNLGQEPQTSIAFEMEEETWLQTGLAESVTEKKDGSRVKRTIRTGKLVFLTDEHPADAKTILTGGDGEGEGVPAEKKAIAAEWLTGYLVGYKQQTNEWPAAKVVRDDANDQGISFATLRRAAKEVGVIKARKGFGPNSYIEWVLPEDHPAMAQLTLTAALPPEADGDESEPDPIDIDTLASLEAALEATPDEEPGDDGDTDDTDTDTEAAS